LNFSSAYLLVSHGSRDLRPQIATEHLAHLILQRLQNHKRQAGELALVQRAAHAFESNSASKQQPAKFPVAPVESEELFEIPVGTAALELAPLPLHQQIQQFGLALAAGYSQLQILPLFLLSGVHVMEDIPAEVKLAQELLGDRLSLELRPHLGSHPKLPDLLRHTADSVAPSAQTAKILLAHGSRRPGSNQAVETIATHLNAQLAYWSVPPSLEFLVTHLVKVGYRQIAVLPYFLFAGGITDAIAQEIHRLAQQFPQIQLHLANPIGATPELADRAVELLN
jgi:sirohydrochlorin cobaltochelatase